MKAEYIYYAGNNYLKIDIEEDYKIQMILFQKVEGLLAFEKISINGENRYLYIISGKQSIRSRYSLRPFSREIYSRILEGISMLNRQLEQYLLDIRDVVFDPDYIFQDMETKEINFVYYPGYGKSLSENLLDFYLFLLEHMDSEDEDFVKEVYLTYDKIDDAGDFFHINMLTVSLAKKEEPEIIEEPADSFYVCEETPELEEETPSENGKLWIMFLLDGVVLYYLWNRFLVSDLSFWIVVGVLAVLNVVLLLIKKLRIKKAVEHFSEPIVQEIKFEPPEDYGKTMFLDPSSIPDEKRLYGMGKGNSYVISLEKTPYTIGKEKEFVDGILSHETISRMHARVTEEGNHLFLEDLNSTNGTYKNGIRLNPLEKVELEAGDEVKFGALRFTYR